MIRNYIFTCLICLSNQSFAQTFEPENQHLVDSLKTIAFDQSNHDTLRVDAYLGLATQYYMTYIDSAQYWIEFAEELSERSHYLIGMSQSYGWMGFFSERLKDADKALEYNFKSIDVLKKIGDYASLATALNNVSVNYLNRGDYPKSIYYLRQSLYVHEHTGNIYGAALAYNNLANIYESQKNYKRAEVNYLKSLEILEEVPEDARGQDYYRGLATGYKGLGVLYKNMENPDLGMDYLEKAYAIALESGDKVNLMKIINGMGSIQFDLVKNSGLPINDPSNDSLVQAAINNFTRAAEIGLEMNFQRAVSITLNNLASVHFSLGNKELAKKYAEESYAMATEINHHEFISESSQLLSTIYEEENRGMEALSMYKLHIQLRDSLFNIENQKIAIEAQTEYEYEKKKALDNAEHNKELAIKEEEKKRQSIISYAAIGGAILLALLLYVVFSRLKITRKQKKTIEDQKIVVEKAHEELEEKNKEIVDSITYAKRIQTAILPPDKLFKSLLPSSFVLYLPKDIVAGDFYWMEQVDETVFFAAADCTGHGVPGAMVSVICNGALNRSVREFGLSDPGQILDKTREIVVKEFEKSEEEVKDGMDIALCSLSIRNENEKKGTHSHSVSHSVLKYAGAHNPLWIVRKGATEIEEIKADKQPIGKFDKATAFNSAHLDLHEGDTFYIFSDGFADQFGGEKGKKYKAKNLKEFLVSIQNSDIREHGQLLHAEFLKWKENFEQLDDVCVIGVRV